MSSRLKGRDINGMRAGKWGKLDTSSIEAPKLGAKATNEDLCNAVKEMLVESVNALYGDPTQKKYVKIVDMLMLRVRGALAELNEQAESKVEDYNKSLNKVLEDLAESFSKTIENHDKKVAESNNEKLQELYEAVVEKVDELKNENKTSNKNYVIKSSQQTDEQKTAAQTEIQLKDQSYASISGKENKSSSSKSSYNFQESLQKQIQENFIKIEKLITSSVAQKNAEAAVVRMKSSVGQQVSYKQSSQKDIKNQIASLSQKMGINISKVENEKDIGEKYSKKDKSSKKNALKDVMTGKQFNVLQKLLVKQFNVIDDKSSDIVKKIDKRQKKTDKKLNKFIEDKKKKGFSWMKLLFFLSLFVIPLLWNKISDFFKNGEGLKDIGSKLDSLAENINVDQLIDPEKLSGYMIKTVDAFIAGFDWKKHIADITDAIWTEIKSFVEQKLSNPVKTCQDMITEAYGKMQAWLKDIWAWISGKDPDAKKQMDKIDEDYKKEMQEKTKETNKEVAKIENKYAQKTNDLESKATQSQNDLTSSMNAAKSGIKDSTDKLDKRAGAVQADADKSDTELKGIEQNTVTKVVSQINGVQSNLSSEIDKIAKKETGDIRKGANEIRQKMVAEGAPTIYRKDDVNDVEKQIASLKEKDSIVPDIKTLAPIKDYVFVSARNEKSTTQLLARKQDVEEQLNKINTNSAAQSATVQHLRNAIGQGNFSKEERDESELSPEELEKYKRRKRKDKVFRKVLNGRVTPEKFFEEASVMYDTVNEAYTAMINGIVDMNESNQKNYDLLSEIKDKLEPSLTSVTEALNEVAELKPEINTALTIQMPAEQKPVNDAGM